MFFLHVNRGSHHRCNWACKLIDGCRLALCSTSFSGQIWCWLYCHRNKVNWSIAWLYCKAQPKDSIIGYNYGSTLHRDCYGESLNWLESADCILDINVYAFDCARLILILQTNSNWMWLDQILSIRHNQLHHTKHPNYCKSSLVHHMVQSWVHFSLFSTRSTSPTLQH